MNINSILENEKYLYESGIRIPSNIESWKILYHNDSDGIGSAKQARQQIINQMMKKFRKKYPDKTDKELEKLIDSRITTRAIADGSKEEDVKKMLKKSANQMVIVVDFNRFENFGREVEQMIRNGAVDFQSDHHSMDDPEKYQGKGGVKTVRPEYKSDTEHLATKVVSKNVNPKMVMKFSETDSATFKQEISKVLGLKPSDTKELELTDELFSLTTAFARTSGTKNEVATEYFIKNGGNTLTSMLAYARKLKEALNLVNKGNSVLKRKKNPSQEEADEARNKLIEMGFPKLAKQIHKGGKQGFVPSKKDYIAKNQKDFEERDKYFERGGKHIVISNLSGNRQPNRYLGFTIPNEETGIPEIDNYFAMLRSWEGMGFFQVSLSPEMPKELRDDIDLPALAKAILPDVKEKFQNKYNKWAFDIIEKEMGGHKSITNIGSLGTLGLMPKKLRTELKELKPIVERINKLKIMKPGNSKVGKAKKAEFLAKIPYLKAKLERADELEELKKEAAKKKVEVMDYFKKLMADETEKEIERVLAGKKKMRVGNPDNEKLKKAIKAESVLDEIKGRALNESSKPRREFKKIAKKHGEDTANAVMKSAKKSKDIIFLYTDENQAAKNHAQGWKDCKYLNSYVQGMQDQKAKQKIIDTVKNSKKKEKFYYYNKKTGELIPGSWDE